MKLKRGHYEHFLSYASLDFDFSSLGLSLISGPTGSGKSAIMDGVAWCLFGTTSKETSADEIKSWTADGITQGIQEVDLPDGEIIVHRTRGKAAQNDLYWIEGNSDEIKRGKDITETQKLLEKRLGVTAELYFAAAYFTQFSSTENFFVAKAKERRETLEKIVDLSLPIRISSMATDSARESKILLSSSKSAADQIAGRLAILRESTGRTQQQELLWDRSNKETIATLQKEAETFEEKKAECIADVKSRILETSKQRKEPKAIQDAIDKNRKEADGLEQIRPLHEAAQKIYVKIAAEIASLKKEYTKFSALSGICPTCLGESDNSHKQEHLDTLTKDIKIKAKKAEALDAEIKKSERLLLGGASLQEEYSKLLADKSNNHSLVLECVRLEQELSRETKTENTFSQQIDRERSTENPYSSQIKQIEKDIKENNRKYIILDKEIKDLENRIASLEQLKNLSLDLRGELLKKVIKDLENNTNENLETYFDGEIRVAFTPDADKVDVEIFKSGYSCSFKALSGGQRCLLKLCFGTSLMAAAANKAGVDFNCLFFDESLNGLDDALKVKAFRLFQKLETAHESVILIDHCESFKSMFSSQFLVSMTADTSTVEHNEG